MDIRSILAFTLVALAIGWLQPRKWLGSILAVISSLTLFWLQPLSPIRSLEFWLPGLSIALTVLVWSATYPEKNRPIKQFLPGVLLLLLVLFTVGASRYSQVLCCLGPARPPPLLSYLPAVLLLTAISSFLYFSKISGWFISGSLLLILIAIFIALKHSGFSIAFGAFLRRFNGQPGELAQAGDLFWLGYSFLAFRLIGSIRDRQLGRLPAVSLVEFAAYAYFFPAVIAGPIDRLQHFSAELHMNSLKEKKTDWQMGLSQNAVPGLERILSGVFKKIIVADSLAFFSLNSQNALQVSGAGWAWMLLAAYSIRIYFDFSGYTDIAIGISRLMGITLPENFNQPYLRTNLTSFWNNWHITLTQWIRAYVFYPLTRFLRNPDWSIPTWAIILAGQTTTMALIGIWHGITWNFLIWGLWHATGLFIQNRWSNWLPNRLDLSETNSNITTLLKEASWVLTFAYVTLGWVFFALPDPEMAWIFFGKLAGLAP